MPDEKISVAGEATLERIKEIKCISLLTGMPEEMVLDIYRQEVSDMYFREEQSRAEQEELGQGRPFEAIFKNTSELFEQISRVARVVARKLPEALEVEEDDYVISSFSQLFTKMGLIASLVARELKSASQFQMEEDEE